MFRRRYLTKETIPKRQHEFEGNKNFIAFERSDIYYDAKTLKEMLSQQIQQDRRPPGGLVV